MLTSEFDYELPPELIAQEPLPERDQSRMMVVWRETGTIEHRTVRDLPEFLRAGDILVMNDTRVIPARILGRRTDTGGKVELLLIEKLEKPKGIPEGKASAPAVECEWWSCMWKASGRCMPGIRMELAGGKLEGSVDALRDDGYVQVRLKSSRPIADVIEEEGVPPVPPYIRRKAGMDERMQMDRERYQTVYARHAGAVAAPTAGLHFTEDLLRRLTSRSIRQAALTLHVGPGTFRPVKVDRVEDHVMEAERYSISEETVAAINDARDAGGRVVAVGSTSVRTLESAMRERGFLVAGSGRTPLFIYPPFAFRVVDAMLTNFHLPRSSLLMMVCAFAGNRPPGASRDAGGHDPARAGMEPIRRAYREAIERRYRFFSYGDCMLIL